MYLVYLKYYCTWYRYVIFFLCMAMRFSSGRGSFLALTAAGQGTQGARVYTTAQVRVPAGLRVACVLWAFKVARAGK